MQVSFEAITFDINNRLYIKFPCFLLALRDNAKFIVIYLISKKINCLIIISHRFFNTIDKITGI